MHFLLGINLSIALLHFYGFCEFHFLLFWHTWIKFPIVLIYNNNFQKDLFVYKMTTSCASCHVLHYICFVIAYKSVSRLGTTSKSFAWFRSNIILEEDFAREWALWLWNLYTKVEISYWTPYTQLFTKVILPTVRIVTTN